jgi:hypothetical protein
MGGFLSNVAAVYHAAYRLAPDHALLVYIEFHHVPLRWIHAIGSIGEFKVERSHLVQVHGRLSDDSDVWVPWRSPEADALTFRSDGFDPVEKIVRTVHRGKKAARLRRAQAQLGTVPKVHRRRSVPV